jgi:xylulokinase
MVAFLGLDIGTSAVKAVLVDGAQHILAAASRPLISTQPHPAWSEQAPEDWWRAVEAVAAEIAQAAPEAWRDLKAIGLSGQMHGLVAIDAAGRVIRPAILWNDARAIAEAAALAAIPEVTRLAGVLPMAGLTAPKALWLKAHEPAHFARIACILLPKDYLRLKLTGERLTDVSDAAGTLWLDQARRAWSPAMIAASGLRPDQLPRIVEGPTPGARLLPEIARAWNLPEPPMLVGGGGDATLGAIGIGAVADGDAFISIGTSAQYFITRDRYVPSGPDGMIHSFAQGLPQRWSQTAALLNGASCLHWFAGLFGNGMIGPLLQEAEAQYAGPRDVMFLPYLAGERTPHNDPLARGMFAGMTLATSRAQLFQAVLEGIGHALVDAQDCLRAAGAEAAHLAIIGGGARSRFWVGILATMLNKPLTLYDGAERGPAFGAARLARIGFTGESVAEICTRPAVLDVVQPRADLAEKYAARQPVFRQLYRATRRCRHDLLDYRN